MYARTPIIGVNIWISTAFENIHHTIANNQLAELPLTLLLPFFLAVNFAEAYRANKGWVDPKEGSLFTLRDGYYPGVSTQFVVFFCFSKHAQLSYTLLSFLFFN